MTKPDYSKLGVLAPATLILRAAAGGELWMGMRPKSYVGYDLVVNCEYHGTRSPLRGYTGRLLRVPLWDDDDFDLEPHSQTIKAAASEVGMAVLAGKKVLVHCTGGLNRSGIVTVLAVAYLHAIEPRNALILVRAARDSLVLCNRAFERWVTGDKLPSAETSAFRFVDGVEDLEADS